MRKIAISLLCFGLFFIFTGCGRRETGSVKSGEKELVMWLVGSESQAKSINKLAENFYRREKIKIRCEAISWGDAHSKYLTSVAGDVTPDIATMGLTWGIEFGSMGVMTDLAKEFPEDIEKIEKETFTGIWRSIEYRDRLYGIPFDLTEHILYYRTDIVEKPPKDWQELTDLLLKLRETGKGMIFDWGSLDWIGFSAFLWQAGGDFYNPEGTKSILNTKEAEEALRFFSELYTKYGVPKTKIPLEQGIRTGDFPLAISGNWKIIGLELGAPEIKGKWSIALLPSGPTGKHTAFLGGRIIGIFKKSQYKKEAWEFIKFLFTPEIQNRLFEAAQAAQDTYLPPNIDSWERLTMDRGFKEILKLQAMDAQGPPAVLGWDASTRFINEAIQKVVLQRADPKGELKKAAKLLTENIQVR